MPFHITDFLSHWNQRVVTLQCVIFFARIFLLLVSSVAVDSTILGTVYNDKTRTYGYGRQQYERW